MDGQFLGHPSFNRNLHKESNKDIIRSISKEILKKVAKINIPKRQFTVFDFKDDGKISFNMHKFFMSNH